MNIKKYDVPHTRDPFINTPLINAGTDPESGEERFWISTWNANVGCLGALITESGKSRIYRFNKENDSIICCGAYSAYLTDNDTMWLISDLGAFVELKLSTGEYEIHRTGAPSCLVFAGMQYDPETKKLMALAYSDPTLYGVSFDTEKKQTVKIYKEFTRSTIAKGGFSNGDGTYTMRFETVHPSLYRWDPKAETMTELAEIPQECELIRVIRDERGRVFVPYMGWLDTSDYTFHREKMPALDIPSINWFARRGSTAYGYKAENDLSQIYTWNISDGSVEKLCAAPDGGAASMTADGYIINVSVYGEFRKFTLSGELVMSTMLDANAQGEIDCLIKIGDRTLLGTPFITQRFWLLDTRTGKSIDAGRAAPGGGEVLRVWDVNGKIYMASYCRGVLTEYDPRKPLDYPNNPRVVAQAPNGMRPVADERIGDVIYYSCTHRYGHLGMSLVRYDTSVGQALYVDDLMHAQHIHSMYYHQGEGVIFAGTTYRSDCDVTPPESDECHILRLCPDTLEIVGKVTAPKGCSLVAVCGAIDADKLLIVLHMPDGAWLGMYDVKDGTIERFDQTMEALGICSLGFSQAPLLRGKDPGRYAAKVGSKVCTCTVSRDGITFDSAVLDDADIYKIFVCGSSVYGVTPGSIYEVEDVL